MPASIADSGQPRAEAVVSALVDAGLDTVCLAPGSRSTPLVFAASRHPGVRLVTHVDERGAAFFCVGYARATGRPAALLTTSGTAVANAFPAVVEAFQDHVPMVLLTADRPPELRGTGANQTIQQPGIFGTFTRLALDLPEDDGPFDGPAVRGAVRRAMDASAGLPAGPVHLNCWFRKPLEPGSQGQVVRGPVSPVTSRERAPDLRDLEADLEGVTRGVVLLGRMDTRTARAALSMAARLGWPVLPDITSQCRLGQADERTITHADLLSGSKVPVPEAVIQVGRQPVSQRLTRWLASGRPPLWAVLADGPERIDPHGAVTHRLCDAIPACRALGEGATPDAGFVRAWIEAERAVRGRLPAAISEGGLTEPNVAAMVAAGLPTSHGLVLASSMPVRDMNTFGASDHAPRLVAANRGASGIDGTISTAAGVSDGLQAPVTVVLGDQAMLHDLNGLGLVRRRPLTLVVINNDGGGIFSFLPVADHPEVFEPYFGAAHGLVFREAATMYGISYEAPENAAAFRDAFAEATRSGEPKVLEVRTNRTANREEHERLGRLATEWVAST